MSSSFDPYHQWLGIRDPQRPPNHYRLLGIDLFESSIDVIETAADRQMAHLRTFQNGPHGEVSQRLLNQVSAAKVCLLDAGKKSVYDAQLRAQQPPDEPPRAIGELMHDDELEVVVKPDSVALRPPGRGPRAERPWYVSMMFLLPLLAVVVALVAYRIYRDHLRPLGNDSVAATDSEATTTSDAPGTLPPDPADDLGNDSRDGAASDDASVSETEGGDGESVAPPAVEPGPSETPADDGGTDPTPAPSDRSDPDRPATSTSPPRWNGDALAVTGQPARFTTSQPMGAFLLALAERDLAASQSALQALRTNQALGLPESLFQEAELVYDSLAQFWQAVEGAAARLQPQDTLTLGGIIVTLVERDESSLKLEAPTGQQQTFDLRRASMHRDLAVALVERHYEASPATGWRLIAVFLAIDREGDVARAGYMAQQAELRGFAAQFLTQIVRHLSGDDVSDAPPLSYSPASPPSATPDGADAALDDPDVVSEALPDSAAQQQAKREVLAPILVELRKQDVPAEQWPQQLLARAADPERDDAARYVLLDNALRRAKTRLDVDTSLAIIDVLARDFGQSRADLRYELIQTVSRRRKGEERRPYAEFARQMARDAVEADDYDEAIRFASLAQSIGRSVPDRLFRKHLLDARLEIDAIRKAFESLPPSASADGEATARVNQTARFRVLAKGDFEHGMSDLRDSDDVALRSLVQQELAPPSSTESQLALAQGWFQFADKLAGVERVNAMRRAEHWYRNCLSDLSRAQRVETQQQLDAITGVLGRESEQLDLTELPPVDVSVGYGTFGINKNIDVASNPKVEALPELDGYTVSRFLWACAPSRIEYLVPEGTVGFQAIGMVNAATSDGVRFVVKANGQQVFVSPLIKVMGGRVPIQVELPAETETLELIVDPIRNNVFDHSYWVDPRFVF